MHIQSDSQFAFLSQLLSGDTNGRALAMFCLAMMVIERIVYALFSIKGYRDASALSNIGVTLLTAIFDGLIGGVLRLAMIALAYKWLRIFELPFTLWGFLLAFLVTDFAFYLDHRIAHRTGLFWSMHMVHHGAREMNLTVASRGFFLDSCLARPIYYMLPAMCGASVLHYGIVFFFGGVWGIVNHTRLIKKMGVLERWICTPANHRVHHGIEAKYLDKNFGQTLLVWDRMFGSWQPEDEEPTYGLTTQIETLNPIKLHFHGLRLLWSQVRSASDFSDKLRYFYKPPGWSHCGDHLASEVLVARAGQIEPRETL